MANPVTTILNPKGDRVMLFWVDQQQRLALSQIPIDASKHNLLYSAHGTPAGADVTNQSIAAVYLRGIPVVFGKIATNDKKLVLGQLSPIKNILAANEDDLESTTVDLPAFAAVSDTEDTAWLYYFKKPAPQAPAVLMEASLNYDNLDVNPVPGMKPGWQPDETSRLAALYIDKDHREVFYQQQGGDSQIYCLRVGSHVEPQHIAGTNQAMNGTPIAVTKTDSGNVYLYYLSSKGDVQRATRTGNEWISSVGTMTQFPSLSARLETQMAVATANNNGKTQNNLFYINSGEKNYKTNVDKGGVE
ncbi:uncharacterized protein B0J16DRAFT_415496 [Fusarium flagelliforme]|uniref:uncharacterized protein n=1 Tax=Fusarium flagelliforme TaxID=2675880 RepID=UPI001E8D02A8|nr:uncharacterized protein B0J16DRAFT_415496 [Fusarium flagelliforme]KAH7186288.1 hypothetical protein B0J16DRAFT_415496 [Fusarium flagelliforme]